jgi:hypothetical protein
MREEYLREADEYAGINAPIFSTIFLKFQW